MQNVDKQDSIERTIGEGNRRAIELRDRDGGFRANHDVNSREIDVGTKGLNSAINGAVAATDIQDLGFGREKRGNPLGEFDSPSFEEEFFDERPERVHCEFLLKRES